MPSEEEKVAEEGRRAEERLRRLVEPLESDSPRLRDHKALVSKDVQKAQSWDALAYAYFGDKLYDRMLEAAEARLSIDRYSYFPWLQKGVALRALGRPADALPAFDEALFWDRENEQAVAWLNKSLIYAERGERELALLHLSEAVRLCPEHKVFARQASQFAPYRDDPEFQALLR
jgi:tetratricopeptide (TPR) repeat protein